LKKQSPKDVRVAHQDGCAAAMSPVEKDWHITFLQLDEILTQHTGQEESEIFNTARYEGSAADQSWT